MTSSRYLDREHAGTVLAGTLEFLRADSDALVLGLPRGGVPVAAVVAHSLGLALDVVIVRKIGFPGRPEYAMGALAVAAGQTVVVRNAEALAELHRTGQGETAFQAVLERERTELERREREYRAGRRPVRLAGRTLVLVDDGAATGATMEAAVRAVRGLRPASVLAAVPVGSVQAVERLRKTADRVLCPWHPGSFGSVGAAYADFRQTTDAEVRRLLAEFDSPGS